MNEMQGFPGCRAFLLVVGFLGWNGRSSFGQDGGAGEDQVGMARVGWARPESGPFYRPPRNQEAQRRPPLNPPRKAAPSGAGEEQRTAMAEHYHLAFSSFLFFFFLFVQAAMGGGSSGGGEWRVLRESIGISAMHMQLMRNDKVAMFDRTDFGASNLSLPGGRCRQDPLDTALKKDCTAHSLFYDLSANAVAPLTVLTDTWCSSGAVLPDGTLLQSGGYNDGDRVVRSLAPCAFNSGAATAACDWVERPGYLAVRRWYATNQILPDGRVVIVGGRRQYSYEFFPREEEAQPREFPFLRETRDGDAENNLYPFLHLLPDGSLFVFANTRAVAIDYATGRVLRTFPAIPGGEPRNYPSTGSSVLLPLRLPAGGGAAAVVAEVLICGGAPRGSYQQALNGTFIPALRTCGRLVLTDSGASWRMETMPAARVMGDMLLLPTGDVIIVNGAGKGTAGWELGRDPVTFPLLYRPDSPSGGRFSVLSRSGIPRMYHSAAMVDTLGRVLVGGSNPHIYYNFTGVEYPTELRLEAFYPPYLDAAYDGRRPTAVEAAPSGAVGYGEPLAVSFEVANYEPQGGVVVALLAPSFTTHSLAMNQRMVVLAVEKVEPAGGVAYRATTAAPPSANIAPPGYYLLFVVHAGVPSKGVWINIH